MNSIPKQIEFTLLYDALCPLCSKELKWLHSQDKNARLGFPDINDVDFDPVDYRKTHDELMAPTGWPVVKPLFDFIYKVFAKYRVRLASLIAGEKSCNCGK